MRRPAVIAHRGASHDAIDNSAEAFERAIEAGADMIEFDVRRTRDDELIAHHDAEVAGLPVSALSRSDVEALTGNLPLLVEEVLSLARGRIALDVELKEDGYVERVLGLVRGAFAAEDVIVTSFLDAVVSRTRGHWPEVRTGLLQEEPQDDRRLVERARACGAHALALEHALVDGRDRDWPRRAGLGLYVWTVNVPEAVRALLVDPSVDGVITDVPGVAVELRAQLT